MNKQYLISIIIPCFNGEATLPKILDLLLAEDLSEIEVLIINDGSTDNTETICQNYATKQNNIRYITKINGGVSSARNLGIKESSGKYFICFDDDDIIEKGTCKVLKQAIENNNDLDIYAFRQSGIFVPSMKKREDLHQPSALYTNIDFLKLFLKRKVTCGVYTLLLNRQNLIEKNIYFDEKLKFAEDYLFIFNILFTFDKVFYSDTNIYKYIISENSTSNKKNFDIKRFEGFIALFNYLKERYSINKSLHFAINFFLADIYSSNLQTYLSSKERNKEFESISTKYKNVFKHFIFCKLKFYLRIRFFTLFPINLLAGLRWKS